MRTKLYTIVASHPCETVKAALRLKGVPYREVELPTGLHRLHQRLRFGQPTVPALAVDGDKVQGSRAIVRRLERLVPEPPLLPADAAERRDVERAERWGDEVLQAAARRIELAAFRRRPEFALLQATASRWQRPRPLVRRVTPALIRRLARVYGADDATVKRDLAALPRHLDEVDALIARGVIGGTQPNVADLQIGASIRLLGSFGDIAPLLAGRPAAALAERLFPDYSHASCPAGILSVASSADRDGNVSVVVAWLDGMRRGALDDVGRLMTPDVRWLGVPADALCRDRHEVMEMVRHALEAGVPRASAIELVDGDDAVVLGVRAAELQEIGGVPLRGQLYHVLRLDGGLITSVEDYATRAEALRAAETWEPDWV